MPKLKDLAPVDAEYALSGSNQNTLVQPIAAPAASLFRCLEDGPAWKEWLGIDVEWTSPEPFGVGTTRTVTTSGQRIDELFLTWDEGERMGFRFERTTMPFRAFAEHYECAPTGAETCELRWSYAFEWGGPLAPVLGKAFGAAFALKGKRSLSKLAHLFEEQPGRWS